ncbi:MAG: hypothetical protein AAGC46_13860, partial [Solirubrobacteraceae bacterium]|nr:hypothetical protein [Patulibacter sp.]
PATRDTTPPTLSLGGLTTSKAGKGKKKGSSKSLSLVVTSSETAQVVATITKHAPGVKKGSSCVAKPAHPKKGKTKRCTRIVTVGSPVRATVAVGSTTLALGKAPSKGSYDVVVTGADAAGNQATPVSKHLVVK